MAATARRNHANREVLGNGWMGFQRQKEKQKNRKKPATSATRPREPVAGTSRVEWLSFRKQALQKLLLSGAARKIV
jgi:hypothetical protein